MCITRLINPLFFPAYATLNQQAFSAGQPAHNIHMFVVILKRVQVNVTNINPLYGRRDSEWLYGTDGQINRNLLVNPIRTLRCLLHVAVLSYESVAIAGYYTQFSGLIIKMNVSVFLVTHYLNARGSIQVDDIEVSLLITVDLFFNLNDDTIPTWNIVNHPNVAIARPYQGRLTIVQRYVQEVGLLLTTILATKPNLNGDADRQTICSESRRIDVDIFRPIRSELNIVE